MCYSIQVFLFLHMKTPPSSAFPALFGKEVSPMYPSNSCTDDEKRYMQRAIELAERGRGFTSPNPLVGAVIVKNGTIIGEGFHAICGGRHAEREALANCAESPRGATLYVTLEPCCHFGRTPPCTDAIIEAGISRVVIGSRDPNPKVSGKGAVILYSHGIKVDRDFLREECDALNPIFFHYITKKRPFVALKYAMTIDGKIATVSGASKWITGEEARAHVHTLRHRYRGILAGIGTVLADDPLLNCRMDGGRSPVRIICDSHLRLPLGSQICKTADKYETIVAHVDGVSRKAEALKKRGIRLLQIPEQNRHVSLPLLMKRLAELEIDSVLAEGGGNIHYSLLADGLAQKAYVYVAPKIFGGATAKTPVGGKGVYLPEDAFRLKQTTLQAFGQDILLEFDVLEGGQPCSQD